MGSTRRRLNVPEDKKILILKRIKIYDHILHDEKYPNVGKRMQKWKEIFEYCKQLEVSINNVRHLQQLFRYVNIKSQQETKKVPHVGRHFQKMHVGFSGNIYPHGGLSLSLAET